jgi:ABC-2 type transport system ATP-binding protein
MSHIIETEDLTKYYGEVHAAEAVQLQVNRGEIYGFLGLNGAGKTTTIRMLLGMIRPTRGKVFLFGREVVPGISDLWNRVGHLVEVPHSYPELTVRENLEIFRRLRSIRNREQVDSMMNQLHLTRYRDMRVKNLSLGNAQRLGIAKAMIHQPDLLILDEPANGLDPSGIVQIRELLRDLAGNRGVTIFISSHILEEVSKLATRIGIIHEGVMIRESDAEQLKRSRRRVLCVNTFNNDKAGELLEKRGHAVARPENGTLELSDEAALCHPEKISSLLVEGGWPPVTIALEEEDLEHFFFRIIETHSKP